MALFEVGASTIKIKYLHYLHYKKRKKKPQLTGLTLHQSGSAIHPWIKISVYVDSDIF